MSSKIEFGTELIETAGVAARLLEERLPDEVRGRLADDVIDELLAGVRSEEEIVGPGAPERSEERPIKAVPYRCVTTAWVPFPRLSDTAVDLNGGG